MSPAVAERKARKRSGKPSDVDPVTAYARAVVQRDPEYVLPMVRTLIAAYGLRPEVAEVRIRQIAEWTVVTGRAARLTCRRHLQNLERQKTAAFPYWFDVAAAQHIIDFYPTFLTLENGDPFHLPPWLQFSYGSIYGWKCWDGRDARGRVVAELDPEHLKRVGARRFIHGFFETSKGSGKTPSAGGVLLYGLGYDDESHAEIYSTGYDKGQASIILNDAIRMGEFDPDRSDPRYDAIMDFKSEFVIDKYNIAHPGSGSFARAMSSQHQSKSGPRPHYVLSDEIHEHRDGRVVGKAEAGFKNRLQPLGLKYTNSGSDKTSYCWELHQKSLAILDGTLVDEQWFAYVCHLDPCEKCYQEGYRQPKDGCAQCDDWTDPTVWPKVAPALGIVIQPKYLRDAIDVALSTPSEYAMKRRLNFCIWTESHQTWMSPDRLEACKVEAVSSDNAAMLPCAMGLDPSSTLDLTSGVIAIRHDDPPSREPAEEVVIEGQDEYGQQIRLVYSLNFHVELIPFFWIPEQTLLERVRTERIPYDVWAREGHLFTTKGPAIDHNAIYDFIIGNPRAASDEAKLGIWKRFKVQKLGMDENSGRYLFMRLRDDGRLGDKVVSVGQGYKLSEAFKFMEILVAHKRLRHNGHPVLMWNFANAEPDRHPRTGALALNKPSETKRIDGVIASAMAIKELMGLPAKRRKSAGVFFV